MREALERAEEDLGKEESRGTGADRICPCTGLDGVKLRGLRCCHSRARAK